MKKIFISAALVASAAAFAQTTGRVGVNTATPAATLEITPNTANAAATATTNEGILIPRLAKARVSAIAAANRVEGTLVYVTDEVLAADNATFTGTGKGFYYYDSAAARWVKMGSGAAASGATNLAPATGSIRTVPTVTSTTWTATDFAIVIPNGGSSNVGLPSPSANNGRIIAISNKQGGGVTFNENPPLGNGGVSNNRGMLLMSDGTNWHSIGGF